MCVGVGRAWHSFCQYRHRILRIPLRQAIQLDERRKRLPLVILMVMDAGDLATVNGTSDDVSVLLGNGNGTFQSAVSFGVGKIPLALVAEDMDLDGVSGFCRGIKRMLTK